MKNLLKFAFFLFYLISIFFLENWGVLMILFCINFLIIKLLKISIGNLTKQIKFLLPFVLFTGLLNIFLGDLKLGMLMMLRLLLAYQITYFFSKSITTLELAEIMERLVCPLKVLKINSENIGIMLRISFCVLPILKMEIEQKKYALKAKGFELRLRNCFMILKPLLISILRRTNEMEKSLKAKGYEE